MLQLLMEISTWIILFQIKQLLNLQMVIGVMRILSLFRQVIAPSNHTASFDSNGDLTIKNSGGNVVLTSSYDKSLGILTIQNTLGSSFKMSDLKTLLETVVYTNSSDKPQLEPRTISVTISDDKKALSNEFLKTINLSPVNDNPTLDLDGDTGSSKEGQDGADTLYVGRVHKFDGVKIAPAAEINLVDSDFISELVVALTNGVADNSGVIELLLTQLGSDILNNKNLSISKGPAQVSITKSTISGNGLKAFIVKYCKIFL